MEWLIQNPIGDMRGEEFLRWYALVIVLTLILCAWLLRQRDPTRLLRAPPISPQLDPYEIAYLRGGENEVIRVVILNLLQRGYLLREAGGDRIARASLPPDPRHLAPIERTVFDWFGRSKSADEIFSGQELGRAIQYDCLPYQEQLRQQNLLLTSEARNSGTLIVVLGLAVILGLGGYKFAVAMAKGRHNVGFLIAMALVSVVVLVILAKQLLPRTSRRGREYLKKLQLAFEKLRGRASKLNAPVENDHLLMLAGVFGVGVLEGTGYDYYPKMFKRASSTGSSSCGAGCGSSSSGGGCGGGGGGGGGCGGCGGS